LVRVNLENLKTGKILKVRKGGLPPPVFRLLIVHLVI